jgi:transcription elongation factor Elf1
MSQNELRPSEPKVCVNPGCGRAGEVEMDDGEWECGACIRSRLSPPNVALTPGTKAMPTSKENHGLLPCPFCGSRSLATVEDAQNRWTVQCADCLSCGPRRSNVEGVASMDWNERVAAHAHETREQEIVGYVPYNWTCNEWDKGTFEGYGEVLFDLSNGWEWRPVYGEKAPAPKASEQRGPYCPQTHQPCERMCQSTCNRLADCEHEFVAAGPLSETDPRCIKCHRRWSTLSEPE